MKFQGTFPEFYRAFADAETAVCMERYGGIDELSLIDVEEKNGVPFPDNHFLKIFSRKGGLSSNRPLCGSALRFLNISSDGTADYLYPENPEIHPWGVQSENFSFFIDRKKLFFLCSSPDENRRSLRLAISTEHLFRGKMPTIKNQRATSAVFNMCREAGVPFDQDDPFPNGTVTSSWQEPQFHENTLIFHGEFEFPYGKRDLFLAMVTEKTAQLSRSAAMLLLDIPWNTDNRMSVVAAFGKTESEAVVAARQALPEAQTFFRKKCEQDRKYEDSAIQAKIEGMPEIAEFLREQNRYMHAFLVADGIGIRAASFKFSFFAMWDAIFPIRDFMRNSEFAQAKKMYRYLLHYPYMNYFPWGSLHLVIMLEEILSYDQDNELLVEAYPILETYFDFARKLTSPETGLIATSVNCGTDVLKEMGIDTTLHYAVCINAFYYNALRIMENFTVSMGKDSAPYRSIRKKIESSYMTKFYDKDASYLSLALDLEGRPAPVPVHENTSTIGFAFPFGAFLMRERIAELAKFQARKLRHPMGRLAVSHDSPIPCEMWRNVHMNQHLGHEMTLARLNGNVPEIKRVMGEYFKMFQHYGVAVETFNVAGCDGNSSQTANWQTFSASAAATAVLNGIAGIGYHAGGYFYLPAEDTRKIRLENLPYKGSRLNVSIEGSGSYAELFFNDEKIIGTMQLPNDINILDINDLKIIRCKSKPKTPVLLSAYGLPIRNLAVTTEQLSFTTCRSGAFPVRFSRVKRVIHGNDSIRIKDTGTTFLDLDVQSGDTIKMER